MDPRQYSSIQDIIQLYASKLIDKQEARLMLAKWYPELGQLALLKEDS